MIDRRLIDRDNYTGDKQTGAASYSCALSNLLLDQSLEPVRLHGMPMRDHGPGARHSCRSTAGRDSTADSFAREISLILTGSNQILRNKMNLKKIHQENGSKN